MRKIARSSISALIILVSLVTVDTAYGADLPPESKTLAQFDADDAYDPFADYSEFDEAQEEEADINFFRHGRFVTLGFIGGMRGFTQGLSQLYTPAPAFGLFLSYFFDLRFALQFSFNTSSHNLRVQSASSGIVASGSVNMNSYGLDLKYYLNTQNVTKGLAKFNPYFIGGFSRVERKVSIEDVPGFGREDAMGFDLGAGIELPMLRNKMFFGFQGMYQLVNFPDKNTEITFVNKDRTGKYPNGDTYTFLGILGINF